MSFLRICFFALPILGLARLLPLRFLENDDTIMMRQTRQEMKLHSDKMTVLFEYADQSGLLPPVKGFSV